MMKLLLEKKFR